MELERVNGFQFVWWVARGGHDVLAEEDDWSYWAPDFAEGQVTDDTKLTYALLFGSLIAQPAPAQGQDYRSYHPLAEHPGLHRKFAQLPLAIEEEDATEVFRQYCNFAVDYGLLTSGMIVWRSNKRAMSPFPVMPPTPPTRVGDVNFDDAWAARAELPALWDEEIHWFREAIRVWDGIQHNSSDLTKAIKWTDGGSNVWYEHPEQRFLGRTRQPGHQFWAKNRRSIGADGRTLIAGPGAWRGPFTPPDVKGPARAWLVSELNHRLAGRVSPFLTETDPPRVSFVPHDLRDAMVVGLFLEVSGQSDLRQCAYCNNWFDAIKPDGTRRRADVRYCSNSCKTQASRHGIR